MSAGTKIEEIAVRIGPYEIAGRIATGGMAHVLVARRAGTQGLPVALKRPRQILDDPMFREMFLDEARLSFQITSSHCVPILDVGTDATGVPYYVMPLVIGAPISKLLVAGPIPIHLTVEIGAQAALGLHEAHVARDARGNALEIVHRDVSPQNILVDIEGHVRVADFGVARAAQRSVKTRTGQIKGKMGYLSPEQAQAKPLDARSDVFSLGIVLWEMLTRQRLFKGGNLIEQHRRLLTEPIRHPSDVVVEVPRPLGDVVMAALERDPERRTQDAITVSESLRAAAPARAQAVELGRFVAERAAEEVSRLQEIVRRISQHGETLVGLQVPGVDRSQPESDVTEVSGDAWGNKTHETPSSSVHPKLSWWRALFARIVGRG